MIYLYIEKTPRHNYIISGYNEATGEDYYKRTYIFTNQREAEAAFRKEYNIERKHTEKITNINHMY